MTLKEELNMYNIVEYYIKESYFDHKAVEYCILDNNVVVSKCKYNKRTIYVCSDLNGNHIQYADTGEDIIKLIDELVDYFEKGKSYGKN